MNEYLNPYYFPSWGTPPTRYGVSEFPSWGSDNISGYGDSGDAGEMQPQQMNFGPMLQGVASGLSAGQAFGVPQNNFQMNKGGVLGAVGSGALAGASAGPVGAAVGGLIGGVTSVFKQDRALKQATNNVNTNFNTQTDMYGRPVFQGGEFAQGFSDLRGLMQATRPGAHALMPRRRRQMEQKAEQLYNALTKGQQNFNQSESSFRNRSIANQEYQERLNRNRNLYSY
jgi:hypothetical protein